MVIVMFSSIKYFIIVSIYNIWSSLVLFFLYVFTFLFEQIKKCRRPLVKLRNYKNILKERL